MDEVRLTRMLTRIRDKAIGARAHAGRVSPRTRKLLFSIQAIASSALRSMEAESETKKKETPHEPNHD